MLPDNESGEHDRGQGSSSATAALLRLAALVGSEPHLSKAIPPTPERL